MKGILILILLLSPVFSQYIKANYIISDPTRCYIINESGNYICDIALNSNCFYDIVISNTKNVYLECNFKRALVYNSTNITIDGYGEVITWQAKDVNCTVIKVYNKTSTQTSYLFCLPAGVKASVNVKNVPLGALGEITVTLRVNRTLKNVLVSLGLTCLANTKPYYTNLPAIFISPKDVYFPEIKNNTIVTIKYYYQPLTGNRCNIILNIKENYTLLKTVENESKTTGSLPEFKQEHIVNANEKFNIFLMFLLILLILLI